MHIRMNSLDHDTASAHTMLPKFAIGNKRIVYLFIDFISFRFSRFRSSIIENIENKSDLV